MVYVLKIVILLSKILLIKKVFGGYVFFDFVLVVN